MAKSKTVKITAPDIPVIQQLSVSPFALTGIDLQRWRNAIISARSPLNPRRRPLYELYQNVMLDAHLLSVCNKRKMGVTNKPVQWITNDGSEVSDEIKDLLLNTPWFYDMRSALMDAVIWGHSLVELIPGTNGLIMDAIKINPSNVRPELGQLLLNYYSDTPYIEFRTDPYYKDFLIESGKALDLGLLESAAYYIIIKRGALGDWAELAEIFGRPFRIGKFNPQDNYSRQLLDEGLEAMGGAGYAVIPDNTNIEMLNPVNAANSSVHKDLVDKCDEQLSKLVLGQTMTTDDGASRSQGMVHKSVEEEMNMQDIMMHDYLLNWSLKNKLISIGYDLGNGHFKTETKIHLDQQTMIDIALKVSSKVPIEDRYFYDTFGIPKPNPNSLPDSIIQPNAHKATPEVVDDEFIKQKRPKTKSESPSNITAKHICCNHTPAAAIEWHDLSEQERNLIKLMWQQKQTLDFDIAAFNTNRNKLIEALKKGFPFETQYGSPDNIAYTMMEINVNQFGFNKNIEQVTQLNEALRDYKDSYSDFKDAARAIMGEFNHNNLRTEYDTAIATAQNASAWNKQVSQQNDYPYLQYQTVNDDSVRPEHAALDGKIFAIDDTTWRAIYPPNGFNCRCEMIQYGDKGSVKQSDITTGAEAKALLGEAWTQMVKTGFDVNRGEIMYVFDTNTAYINKLKDAPDATKINYKSINLPAQSEMKGLSELVRDNSTPETLKHEFDSSKVRNPYNDKDYKMFSDYDGRKIGLERDNFLSHLKEKYTTPDEQRDKLFHNVSGILKNPDEVWMTKNKNTVIYNFIKFYSNGEVMIVPCDVEMKGGKTLTVKTWFTTKGRGEDGFRKGIPVKTKTA